MYGLGVTLYSSDQLTPSEENVSGSAAAADEPAAPPTGSSAVSPWHLTNGLIKLFMVNTGLELTVIVTLADFLHPSASVTNP